MYSLKKDEINKERKEISARMQNDLGFKDLRANTEKFKGKTVFSPPKNLEIGFQGRSLARGSGEKYEDCSGIVNLLNFQI